ncbi:hypothetical protein DLAC_07852 [Tieghemostelium lacteum]|uniref:Histidine ammonia-lyase n=1 Tax=Tieghemostelium lacteum TaxID=361077 RepID=A0A151ZAL2_TIELA|nr:hypothetical protein DLAC_07852 [Tieghemostelium lacteum]|eukprot:KYQ90968.1 hypothetical protein DLAC_07852 [Tieghemostelium lacteum]
MNSQNTDVILLTSDKLNIKQIVLFSKKKIKFTVSERSIEKVKLAREVIERIVENKIPSYGITTGVGSQKDYIVERSVMNDFQHQLLTAHSTVMTNSYVPDQVVRASLLIQLNLFCSGTSGISIETFNKLIARLQDDNLPLSVDNCSVGASDIVSLSQMSLNLFNKSIPLPNGQELQVPKLRDSDKLENVVEPQPFKLQPKEGLSLMNSNSLTLAQGVLLLYEIQGFLKALDLVAAFSLEGFRANLTSINQNVYQIHNQAGQVQSANNINSLLSFSKLWSIQEEARFVQDPLSFRCITQIHGAAYSSYDWCSGIYEKEVNLPVDNPLVSLEDQNVYSHGNMENTLLALSMDTLRSALCKCIRTSGERIHKLHWPQFSGLSTGLSQGNGMASGGVQFLNLSHLASSSISHCGYLSNPTLNQYQGQLADGVEDVAGMAPLSISCTKKLLDDGWKVLTIELIIAIWAINYRNIPVTSIGFGLRSLHNLVLPLLPIGKEGEKVFDTRPIESILRDYISDNQ